ncbi:hypothetical protein [Streptomyces sp. SID11385]|uniref:hypothetical protein n=1 Tax=Streptomyces sp. SID11385 TaxID=2706031 RepID=UPI0019444086|nr:hypothetical protein [Streptomyces sp. SID11385]
MSGTATTAVRGHGAREVTAGRGTAGEPVMLGDVLPEVLRALHGAEGAPRQRGGYAGSRAA